MYVMLVHKSSPTANGGIKKFVDHVCFNFGVKTEGIVAAESG